MTNYAYDPVGNLLTKTDANGHATNYTYDAANRLSAKALADGATWRYGYDPAGNLTSMTDAKGNATAVLGDSVTTYSYDAAGRLARIDYSSPATPDVGFSYDPNSNLIGLTDGAGGALFAFDALNRLTSETRSGHTISYEYDPVGNVIQRAYPDGALVDYSYDADEMFRVNSSGHFSPRIGWVLRGGSMLGPVDAQRADRRLVPPARQVSVVDSGWVVEAHRDAAVWHLCRPIREIDPE